MSKELETTTIQSAPTQAGMRLFHLYREEDESGVSGTGVVAEGVEFTNGMCVLSWLNSNHACINTYVNIKAVVGVHGHGGKTRVVFLDEIPPEEEEVPAKSKNRKGKNK